MRLLLPVILKGSLRGERLTHRSLPVSHPPRYSSDWHSQCTFQIWANVRPARRRQGFAARPRPGAAIEQPTWNVQSSCHRRHLAHGLLLRAAVQGSALRAIEWLCSLSKAAGTAPPQSMTGPSLPTAHCGLSGIEPNGRKAKWLLGHLGHTGGSRSNGRPCRPKEGEAVGRLSRKQGRLSECSSAATCDVAKLAGMAHTSAVPAYRPRRGGMGWSIGKKYGRQYAQRPPEGDRDPRRSLASAPRLGANRIRSR